MIDIMSTDFTSPWLRAFKQAPWRTQTQAVAAWSVVLLTILVLGGLYLTVAARAGTAGRDLQTLEIRKAALIQQNDELRAELARLRSVTLLAERARLLGFQPARPDQIEYLRVEHYPHVVETAPVPRAQVAVPAAQTTLQQLETWLAHALQGLVTLVGQVTQFAQQTTGGG